MTKDQERVLRTARTLLDVGWDLEKVLENPLIPVEMRGELRVLLLAEQTRVLSPARVISSDQARGDWVGRLDRSSWHYWPTLRQFLLTIKGWSVPAVRSLDDSSDRILRQLQPPTATNFDTRGLVLGFVQSGKTASFTALAAKAADAGYRLIIVLSGIDNGLRRQTQIRLNKELVGYSTVSQECVPLPPMGRQWIQFTSEDLSGDFRPGNANQGALQGTQPVLLVVKKNGAVLRRLLNWLRAAPDEVRATLPLLVVDDEADQASVDTRGTYQSEDPDDENEYLPPSVINARIRELLGCFQRRAYVAYTATPFANILIPHDTVDPEVGSDLYPKDFIVDLPKPDGHFGAEEIFGRFDPDAGENVGGMNVIRNVPDDDTLALESNTMPKTLEVAILSFVLAGASRAQRGQSERPATMLIHQNQRIADQAKLKSVVETRFFEIRDEWRYQRQQGIRERMSSIWESEFRPVTRSAYVDRDVAFSGIEPFVGEFLEAVQVKEVNSATGEVLDYDREPSLKAIAIGGNRLSRGLTLEGLVTSYFLRQATMYDTLMQMGRWFGFRTGYEDLTRVWMPQEIAGWFSDLAFVESQLRADIEVYESHGITPYELGMRIWQHPTMQVTSPLKRRFASETTISQSYSFAVQQTFKFPFSRPVDLAAQAESNKIAVRRLIGTLGSAAVRSHHQPYWIGVQSKDVLEFIREYQVDGAVRSLSTSLIAAYIERMNQLGELRRWVVSIRGRDRRDSTLGQVDWGLVSGPVNQVSRSRIRNTESVGVITSPGDEAIGLDPDAVKKARELMEKDGKGENPAARSVRSPEEGLLLLYPISRFSGYELDSSGIRTPLFHNANDTLAKDLVGVAISFPRSHQYQHIEAYLEGSVGWRPVE